MLQRRIQILTTCLVILGGLTLGLGRGDARWPALTIAAAAGALYVTDLRRWFVLARPAIVAALACVIYSVARFLHRDPEMQLLITADLLVYLQIVLLFQEKHDRVCWQITTLSLLQIVVASALTASFLFGLLIVAYVALGLVYLWLMQLRREMPALNSAAEFKASSANELLPESAPLALWPGWRPFSGWFLATLVLGALAFLLMPRPGQTAAVELFPQQQPLVSGFAETMRLGAMGDIVQNSETVMRIRFVDPQTGQVYPIVDTPLLRGSVLTHYESPKSWDNEPTGTADSGREAAAECQLGPPAASDEYIVQIIAPEPTRDRLAFSVCPPVKIPEENIVEYNVQTTRLTIRPPQRGRKLTEFKLGTLGLRAGRLREITPLVNLERRERASSLVQLPDKNSKGVDPLPKLRATAERILRDAGLKPEDDRVAAAHTLQAYLRDSGQFRYSLEGQERDSGVDPLEDFVSVHRVGHCEYFAGALCLMLRSVGIPARVAIGYQAERNAISDEYFIRQLHAHAWVEAYLEPSQIPESAKAGLRASAFDRGGWLVLNPTPSAGESSLSGPGWLKWWRDANDYAQRMWTTYVVTWNDARQWEWIYRPVADAVRDTFDWLAERCMVIWRALPLQRIASPLNGLLIAAGIITFGVILRVWRGRIGWPSRWMPRGKLRGKRGAANGVDFARRWEALVARLGWRRAQPQTQREFALALRCPIAQEHEVRLRRLSRRVVDAYYRVRFGGLALDKSEAAGVEQALNELETLVRDVRRMRSKPPEPRP